MTDTTETPVYSGTGWKILTSRGIYSLNPDPYLIYFADTAARDKLTPYLTGPTAQATTVTGVQIVVTDQIDTTPKSSVPPRHRIVVHYCYQPMGQKGMSQALPCYQLSDSSAWGGHVLIDTEYWSTATWFSADPVKNEAMRANAVTHELGHVLGLDHPNTDLDKDSFVEAYETPTNSAGYRPVMTSPNGGAYGATTGGQYLTEFDAPGLAQLARNWYLRQTPTTTAVRTMRATGDRAAMAEPVH